MRLVLKLRSSAVPFVDHRKINALYTRENSLATWRQAGAINTLKKIENRISFLKPVYKLLRAPFLTLVSADDLLIFQNRSIDECLSYIYVRLCMNYAKRQDLISLPKTIRKSKLSSSIHVY